MGPFGGQRLLVSGVVTDFDSETTLTTPDVDTVVIDISDPSNTLVVSNQPMSYNPEHLNQDGNLGAYEYFWDTPATGEGAYQVRIQATGPRLNTKNYKVVRLRRNKAPF